MGSKDAKIYLKDFMTNCFTHSIAGLVPLGYTLQNIDVKMDLLRLTTGIFEKTDPPTEEWAYVIPSGIF
jgi:hypothetical protein